MTTVVSLVATFMFLIVSGAVYSAKFSTAERLHIAVASNFLEASQQLAIEFEKTHGSSIVISSGSSGKLYHQIMHGAPFDIFLSADKEKPQQLIANQKAQATSLTTYAKGQLVLWLKTCDKQSSLNSLTDTKFRKIAIANPKLAPYGSSAHALLKTIERWVILEDKLVFPENIAQVSQLAKLGVVDAAFIAKAQANHLLSDSKEQTTSCVIDLANLQYPDIEQQLVIVSASRNQALATAFIAYLKSAPAQALIKNMGYLVD